MRPWVSHVLRGVRGVPDPGGTVEWVDFGQVEEDGEESTEDRGTDVDSVEETLDPRPPSLYSIVVLHSRKVPGTPQ